ncbi:hypothetical protein BXZ70DRAFT_929897 [Cristinia sonorae]|uniref:BTB domain-containing protein n=1 Tax=Cristinia sonorae TaxID=1940300 RepID=A0A8K0UT49_9AGAR|nr:hypothetical protein BXZ70DRAFT_929897 [Cristinia sonorae]
MTFTDSYPAMETSLGLPRLEIPSPPSPSDVPALSPDIRSAAKSLPHLSPVGEEQNTSLEQEQPFLSSAVSPTYVDSHIPPTIRPHLITPPFHSRSTSASSVELLVPGTSSTPLLDQEFEHAHAHIGQSTYSGIFSPRSFRTMSSRSSMLSPRMSTPPSATALSASQLHPPLQIHALRPKARSGSTSTTVAPPTPSSRPRHSSYYMDPEMVILEVEGYLYRVSVWLLQRESDFFQRHLRQHLQNGVMGRTDGTPIPLPNISRNEFDDLLRFLHFSVYEPDLITLDEWIALLSVSTRLQFPRIRRWAIREITAQFSNLEAVTVVVLATKHNVPQWLAPAYAELCRREEPLDDGEAEELGAVVAARVGRARERIREELFKTLLCGSCIGALEMRDDQEPEESLVTNVVRQVFWPESSRPLSESFGEFPAH